MLSASTASMTRKHYAILGKLLTQKKPDIAQELITTYLPTTSDSFESDVTKIPYYFNEFCQIEGISKRVISGSFLKREKTQMRRKFIAVILHLYTPAVFTSDASYRCIRGIVVHLSATLGLAKSTTSEIIKQVIVWQKNYDDFALSVQETLNQIEKKNETAA